MTRRRGYGQFCPVAKGAEIFAERWTPLIVRELLMGSTHFSDVQRGVPLCSPSVLSKRLRELVDAGIVDKRGRGASTEYTLTAAGEDLRPMVEMLGLWGRRHVQHAVDDEDLDAGLLMWDIRRGVDPEGIPAGGRVVVRFELSGAPPKKSRWWLVFDRGEVDLCLQNPGYEIDLVVCASLRSLTEVWVGSDELQRAIRGRAIRLEGRRAIVRSFPQWFALSHIARIEG